MKKILIVLIFVFFYCQSFAGIYSERVKTWQKVEHIKNILLPNLLESVRIDIIKSAERGDAYYRLKEFDRSKKCYEKAIQRIDDLNNLIDFYDEYNEVKSSFLKVKSKYDYLIKHNFSKYFPDEDFLTYYDESERSYIKLENAMKSLDYKVARRRIRVKRIKENLSKAEKGISLYSDKTYWFDVCYNMYSRIKYELDSLNLSRDLARNPINIHDLRVRNERVKKSFDKLLSKAQDSIYYVGTQTLKLLYEDFSSIADDLGDITFIIDEPVVTLEQKSKLANRILNDYSFKGFFKEQYRTFEKNYDHFLTVKKSANTPTDIKECEIYLNRALKIKKVFLDFADYQRRENELKRWLFKVQKRDNFTPENEKSFSLLSVKNYLIESSNARDNGNYSLYKRAIVQAEKYREKYEEN